VHSIKQRFELGRQTRRAVCACGALIFGWLLANVPFAAARPLPEAKPTKEHVASCKILYAGFVGAMETSHRKGSGVVQLRNTLNGPGYTDVCAESFIPLSWESCRDWIVSRLPGNSEPRGGAESADPPRIIMVGHSTGGWAMIEVARYLRDRGIPIELVVLLDSVGISDRTVPRNVREIAVFRSGSILRILTTKNFRMEDQQETTLVANVVAKKASHLSITRDPRVRDLVLGTVDELRKKLGYHVE